MTFDRQLKKLREAAADALLPSPEIDLADWAEQNVKLSSEDSATRGDFVPWPFQREPMSVMSPMHPAEKVAMKCGSQTMKTRLILNMLAYLIAQDPGPCLIIEPTADDAESLSKDRLDPMFRDTPALKGKVKESKSRDAGNTIFHKKFDGGHVTIAYATAPSKLAMRPIRYMFFDEVSRYVASAGKEGDPVRLGEKRTVTFWNRKLIYASSPGNAGSCRISEIYEFSDQREWFVPCPFCGHEQILVWAGITWGPARECHVKKSDGHFEKATVDVDPERPCYRCAACDCLIPEHFKSWMLEHGRWIAQNPAGKYPGFHVSQLASPVRAWGDIVQEWLEIQGKPEQIKVFVNTVLGETYQEQGEAPDFEKLMARREDSYRLGQVPEGVLFLTAGVDVQKTWIEGYVWGWGRGKQRWLVDHFRIDKNPYDPTAWDDLTAILNRTYRHPSGADLALVRMAVDTGHASNEVYAWARQHGSSRVLAVDGRSSGAAIILPPTQVDVTLQGRRIKHGCKLWGVNVSMCKSELYGLLGKERPQDGEPYPAGWVHFPSDAPEEFFRQLTAEQLTTRVVKGYRRTEWQKIRERNEALDCYDYARAAASQFGLDRNATYGKFWVNLEIPLRRSVEMNAGRVDRVIETPEVVIQAPVMTSAPPPAQKRTIRARFNL